jgi:hypothetical protein
MSVLIEAAKFSLPALSLRILFARHAAWRMARAEQRLQAQLARIEHPGLLADYETARRFNA